MSISGSGLKFKFDEQPGFLSQLFFVCLIIGLVGIALSLIAAFFSRVTRQPTWYNFMIVWFLYCVAFLLLLFSGEYNKPDPPFALCLVQSAWIHSASPSAAAATLALIIQLFLNVHSAIPGRVIKHERIWIILILILPYVVMLVNIILSLVLALGFETNFYILTYCSVSSIIPGRVTAGLTIICIIPVLVFNGTAIIYFRLRKHWAAFRASPLRTSTSMFIRASVFSIFSVAAVLAGFGFFLIALIHNPHDTEAIRIRRAVQGYSALNTVLGIFPMAVFIVFGTQRDLLYTLLFWKKYPQVTERESPNVEEAGSSVRIDTDIAAQLDKELEAYRTQVASEGGALENSTGHQTA